MAVICLVNRELHLALALHGWRDRDLNPGNEWKAELKFVGLFQAILKYIRLSIGFQALPAGAGLGLYLGVMPARGCPVGRG